MFTQQFAAWHVGEVVLEVSEELAPDIGDEIIWLLYPYPD